MFELRQIFNIVRLLNYIVKLKCWIMVFYVSRGKHVHRSHQGMEFPWNIDGSLSAVCLQDSQNNLYSCPAVCLVQPERHWKQVGYKHSSTPCKGCALIVPQMLFFKFRQDFRCIALRMHVGAYSIFCIACQRLFPTGTQFLTLPILGKMSRTFEICTTCEKGQIQD